MNDERFFDLAMKVIARQCTDAERAELDALLAREEARRTEFARLEAAARVAKDALPLVDATRATAGELPAYALGRLQTKVRQTLGRPAGEKEPDRSFAWGWRWWLGLAAAAAVVMLVVLPGLRTPNGPVIQVAMLDLGGATRGGDTNEVVLLNQSWQNAKVDSFTSADELRAWETNWPHKQPIIKIIYDHAAGEVRVLGRWEGKNLERTFIIDQSLATTLKQVRDYIAASK